MKIALIGASGFVGRALLNEILRRGYQVSAIARHPENIHENNELLTKVKADAFVEAELQEALKGHEVVISAYNAGWTNPNIYDDFLKGSKSIQAAVKEAGIKRYIVIGGAGSLEVAPGLRAVDTPDFPEAYKAGAKAARDYLDVLKEEKDLDWTFVSPAFEMNPSTSGKSTGVYRTGLDQPVFDKNGRSIISVEDLAVAILDEAENSNHLQQRFTAAY